MTRTVSRRAILRSAAVAAAATLGGRCRVGSAAASTAVPLDVVTTQGVSGLTIYEVARSQGYFEQLGVAPRMLLVSDGSKSVAALVSGAAKLCIFSGFNQVPPAIERGARLKILAGALNQASLAMYSGHPEIARVTDLTGRVIGIGAPGSVLHQMTVLLLRKRGVDPDKVMFRNVGSNADILKAVSAKTVDAGLSDVDVFDEQQRFGIHALSDGLLWKQIPEYPNQASYASATAIQSDRTALIRVLAGLARAYRFVSGPASQDVYVRARQKVSGMADPAPALTTWRWIQQTQPYALNLALSDAQLNLVQQLNVEFKVQQRVLPISQIADQSLAGEALKLLTAPA